MVWEATSTVTWEVNWWINSKDLTCSYHSISQCISISFRVTPLEDTGSVLSHLLLQQRLPKACTSKLWVDVTCYFENAVWAQSKALRLRSSSSMSFWSLWSLSMNEMKVAKIPTNFKAAITWRAVEKGENNASFKGRGILIERLKDHVEKYPANRPTHPQVLLT